ncbi:MAG: putative DNA-binding domain-containing protein, partial [Gammaproteobacteria bacterium]
MNNLMQIQLAFQRYLFKSESTFETLIVGNQKAPAKERLTIYVNAYQSRLMNLLTKDFPVLYKILGHENFNTMAKQYIARYPSSSRSIRWFGEYLSLFLMERYAELAKFEWNLSEAFDAADSEILTIEQLSAMPAETWPLMQLTLIPSVRVGNVEWNTLAVWQAAQQDGINMASVKLQQPLQYLVWRKQYQVKFRELTNVEMVVIQEIIAGKNFAEICEKLCEVISSSQVALEAVTLLKKWINEGW